MEAVERETIINLNEKEQQAGFYTCNRAWMAKLERLGLKAFRTSHHEDGRIHAKEYSFPKRWVSIRKTRKLTGEALEKARKTAKKNLKRKK